MPARKAAGMPHKGVRHATAMGTRRRAVPQCAPRQREVGRPGSGRRGVGDQHGGGHGPGIDPGARQVVATLPADAGAHNVTFSPDAALAFIANVGANNVTIIDAVHKRVLGRGGRHASASRSRFARWAAGSGLQPWLWHDHPRERRRHRLLPQTLPDWPGGDAGGLCPHRTAR